MNDAEVTIALIQAAENVATNKYADLKPEELPLRKQAEAFLTALWKQHAASVEDESYTS